MPHWCGHHAWETMYRECYTSPLLEGCVGFGGRKVNKPDTMRVPMAHTNRKGPPSMCCIQGLSLGVLWANSCPKQLTPVHREHWCGVGVICPPRVMYWKFGVQCGNVRGSNTLEKWHPLAPDEVIWLWPLERDSGSFHGTLVSSHQTIIKKQQAHPAHSYPVSSLSLHGVVYCHATHQSQARVSTKTLNL